SSGQVSRSVLSTIRSANLASSREAAFPVAERLLRTVHWFDSPRLSLSTTLSEQNAGRRKGRRWSTAARREVWWGVAPLREPSLRSGSLRSARHHQTGRADD